MVVKYCDEFNSLITHAKVRRIGEPVEQRPADLVSDMRELQWTLDYPAHDRVEFVEKLITKSGPLILVPRHGVSHIAFGRRPDNEPSRHPLGLR